MAQGWKATLADWAVPAALMIVPVFVLHELAHGIVALLLGVPAPRLHFNGFAHGPAPGLSAWARAAIGAAGPLATLAIGAAALSRASSANYMAAAVVAAAARAVPMLPFVVASVSARWEGRSVRSPNFDEAQVGKALGIAPDLLMIATVTVSAFLAVRLATRIPGRAWLGLVPGALAGWWLWTRALGPALLP